jgi:hypothetical protein
VEAYRAPYAALNLAEAMLFAREAWTVPDAARFTVLALRYQQALSAVLQRLR